MAVELRAKECSPERLSEIGQQYCHGVSPSAAQGRELLEHILWLRDGGLSMVRRRAFEAERKVKAMEPVIDAAVKYWSVPSSERTSDAYFAIKTEVEAYLKGGDADGPTPQDEEFDRLASSHTALEERHQELQLDLESAEERVALAAKQLEAQQPVVDAVVEAYKLPVHQCRDQASPHFCRACKRLDDLNRALEEYWKGGDADERTRTTSSDPLVNTAAPASTAGAVAPQGMTAPERIAWMDGYVRRMKSVVEAGVEWYKREDQASLAWLYTAIHNYQTKEGDAAPGGEAGVATEKTFGQEIIDGLKDLNDRIEKGERIESTVVTAGGIAKPGDSATRELPS